MKRRKNFIPITVDNKQFLYNISGTKLIYYDSNDRKFEISIDIPGIWKGREIHKLFDKSEIGNMIRNNS